jgi:alcohol dehydrogenase
MRSRECGPPADACPPASRRRSRSSTSPVDPPTRRPPRRRGPPGAGRIGAVALNHIDVWGWRGMAFAKRKLPIVIGAEAAGTVVAAGDGVGLRPGRRRRLRRGDLRPLPGLPRGPRQSLRERRRHPRLPRRRPRARDDQPAGPPARSCAGAGRRRPIDAACAPITYGTPEHMLFDNARLKPGRPSSIQAGGSASAPRRSSWRRPAGRDGHHHRRHRRQGDKAKALGADHVINYKQDRFEGVVRKLTAKQGVDVVFEHVGPTRFARSMFCLKRGGGSSPAARPPASPPRSTCSSSTSSSSA